MRDFQTPGRSAVFADNGMCATSHPLAAKAAVDILAQGGNAVDAAIAGAVILGICEPQMTGIGGDCFILMSQASSDKVISLNGSGRAPVGANADALRERGQTTIGLRSAEAVTIPTALRAFETLSNDYGKLGLDASLQPAIHYADHGVRVAPRVAYDWAMQESALHGSARKHFLIGDRAPKTGDLFAAKGQAEVLRRIAKSGTDAFYSGEIADDMIAALRALGGTHTADDFANAHADYTAPISGTYMDVDLVEHPPNGQGAVAILMLNMLKNFDLASMDPFGAERAHIEAEVAKLAYDARNRFIADTDVIDRRDYLTAQSTADKLAALIRTDQVIKNATQISEAVHKDTIYITVVDRDRMAVSLIYSIFHGFGSGIASEKFGILLQNRGAGFNLTKDHPNEYGPNKRPMHTIIPGMLRQNGRTIMPFGVMGGQYQPNGHARFVTNMLTYGMDAQSAIDAPRCFAEAGKLTLETGYCDEVFSALSKLGHDVQKSPTPIGGAQAIKILDNGALMGASDPRKDGCALGY